MYKSVLLLAFTVGLVTCSVLNKNRVAQDIGVGNVGHINEMTLQELHRQKFILDVLRQVQQPLVDENLLELANNAAVDSQMNSVHVDEDILYIIELIRNHEILGKNDLYTISNDQHVRQMIGLYHLFVRSQDFSDFQRNVVFARVHVNSVLFVNSLLLAIRDREDTQKLIVPALHEILPELFYDEDDINKVRSKGLAAANDDISGSGLDGLVRGNKQAKIAEQVSVLQRPALWMPWRELHLKMALLKVPNKNLGLKGLGGNTIVVPVQQRTDEISGLGLLTDDVAFKSFLDVLTNELILNQAEVQRESIGSKLNRGRVHLDIDEGVSLVGNRNTNADTEDSDEISDGTLRHNVPSLWHTAQSENGYQGVWDGSPEKQVPTVTKNDQQWLHINQRPSQSNDEWVHRLQTPRDRDSFRSIAHGATVSDGRRVVVGENEDTANKRSHIKNQIQDDVADRQLKSESKSSHGSVDSNKGSWRSQWEQGKEIQNRQSLDDSFPTTAVVNGRQKVHNNVQEKKWISSSNRGQLWESNSDEDWKDVEVNDEHWHGGQHEVEVNPTHRINKLPVLRGEQSVETQRDGTWCSNVNCVQRPVNGVDNPKQGSQVSWSKSHRSGRSPWVGGINQRTLNAHLIGGELLLHNLQQLVARINMECISLDDSEKSDDWGLWGGNNQRLINAADERLSLRLNRMRWNVRRNRILLAEINAITQRINAEVAQGIHRIAAVNGLSDRDQSNAVGNVLAQALEGVGVLHILQDVLQQNGEVATGGLKTNIGNSLKSPIVQMLLRRVVGIIDVQRQKLASHQDSIKFDGVSINEVKVDKLRTFVENSEVDLSNLQDVHTTLNNRNNQKVVIGSLRRLNHKAFTVSVDVTSDRNQQVVIRTLLGPKVDAIGNEVPLNEQRQNYMLLGATVVQLKTGRNTIKHNSEDISWTSRDTTPYSEIYQRVLRALQGAHKVADEPIVGQSTRFPHHLLLPRGRVEGLPVQILVVITPAQNKDHDIEAVHPKWLSGIGVGAVKLDNLPLGFPLDREINDVDQFISLPNVYLKDAIIYHEDKIKGKKH